MRFVPIKTEEQLDWQALHRVRVRWGDAPHGGGQSDPQPACRTGIDATQRPVSAQPVDATPPDIDLLLKGGVRDAETMEVVFGLAGRYVEPLEGWTVVNAIGRVLGKDKQVIHFLLARHGGIAPRARRRAKLALTLGEREDISRGIARGCSMRAIAQGLHRACSTISREVARYGGHAQYRANQADQQAWESALRPKPYLLAGHSKLQEIVASKLMQDWSPEQISGWLKMEYPNDESLRVSHE